MQEKDINTGAKIIQQLLKYKSMKIKDLSELLGYSSHQILRNKLYRDTLPLNEFVHIVNILGGEVKAISQDGKNEYIVEYKEKNIEEE